jgi:DNA mismatch repair protein MutL
MADRSLIRVLPPDVVNRIAAGEVIERPASVVKELVENALDAGASRIEVEVREGGKRLIRVADDGQGMAPEDLERAFLPHATSKLSDVEDLLHIGTLGFRGEALASIGAVARARITSRVPGSGAGHVVENAFGRISEVRPGPSPEGTVVEVEDLFRRVPARAKFLKSTRAEMARITEVLQEFGISTPDVGFRLTHAGRTVVHFPPALDRRGRIARAYGRDLTEELIEVRAREAGMDLFGLIAPPARARADTTRMIFFLNGRRVRDRTLLHASRAAYEDLIFGPRSPVLFVFLTMDPEMVDQNVHPAKLEVRFRDSRSVHSLVQRCLREALVSADLAHPLPVERSGRDAKVREAVADFLARSREEAPRERGGSLFPPGSPGAGRPEAGGGLERAVDFLQVRDTFIVLETEEGITILDQHALHERVLYDRIRSRYLAGRTEVQRLLRPAVLELGAVERATVLERRAELARAGLLVEEFGDDGIAVQGLPAAAAAADPVAVVEDLLGRLAAEESPRGEELVETVLATLACRAAVKAGDRLGREHVAALLSEAERITHAHTCPHGRPTSLRISYGDLERHFKRR